MSNAGRPELARGGLNPITTDPAPDTDPLWTPNGQQVVFSSQRGGVSGLYRRNADGTGDVEQLMIDEDAGGWFARTWASDGDALVFERRVGAQSDLALLSLGDELTVEPLLDSEFNESRTMLSPNGRWIAYDSNRSGQPEVYVEWFPELGDRELISTQGGRRPRWSPDGHELFYLSLSSDRLAVVSVTAEEDFTPAGSDTLAEGRFLHFQGRATYDVAPDGRLVATSAARSRRRTWRPHGSSSSRTGSRHSRASCSTSSPLHMR